MTREEMLNKLQGIGFAFIDPASGWEDIGFTERVIWVNAAGYGWVACDEPNTFYGKLDPIPDDVLYNIKERLRDGSLVFEDVAGTSLTEIPFCTLDDENLFEFLKGVLELPDKLGTEFYCVDTIDGIEFCTSEKECQKLLMRDWCDIKWEELNDKMLRIWIDRLAEEDPEYWY